MYLCVRCLSSVVWVSILFYTIYVSSEYSIGIKYLIVFSSVLLFFPIISLTTIQRYFFRSLFYCTILFVSVCLVIVDVRVRVRVRLLYACVYVLNTFFFHWSFTRLLYDYAIMLYALNVYNIIFSLSFSFRSVYLIGYTVIVVEKKTHFIHQFR